MATLADNFMTGYAAYQPAARVAVEFQQQQEDRQRADASRKTLAEMATSLPPDMAISQRYTKLADAMLPIDPAASFKLADEAVKLQDQEYLAKERKYKVDSEQLGSATAMASGVQSQADADGFYDYLAANPLKNVPPGMLPPRIYNEQTKPQWDRFAQLTTTAADRMKLDKMQTDVDYQRKRESMMDEREARLQADADRKERQAQAQIAQGDRRLDLAEQKTANTEKARKSYLDKPATGLDLRKGIVEVEDALAEKEIPKEGLPMKLISEDLHDLTNSKMKADPDLPREQARAEALDEVLGRVYQKVGKGWRNQDIYSYGYNRLTGKQKSDIKNGGVSDIRNKKPAGAAPKEVSIDVVPQ